MAALAAHLEAAVHAAVEARNKRWKATMWSDFLKHAVAFLLTKGRDQDDVVAAAVGLIVYGVTTEVDLQGVAGQPPDDEKFKRQLAEEGVPKAICDMLFAQYVAGKSDRGRSSSGGELDDRPVKRRLVDVQDEFFATVPDAKMTKDTMSCPKTIVTRSIRQLCTCGTATPRCTPRCAGSSKWRLPARRGGATLAPS